MNQKAPSSTFLTVIWSPIKSSLGGEGKIEIGKKGRREKREKKGRKKRRKEEGERRGKKCSLVVCRGTGS